MMALHDDSLVGVPSPARRIPQNAPGYFCGLLHDFAIRIEWFEQALDGIPEPQASSGAAGLLRNWAKALDELLGAVAKLQEHLHDRRFAKLFELDRPLAAYLGHVYAWCGEMTLGFEALAVRLRRSEPVLGLLLRKDVNDSFQRFHSLVEPLCHALFESRPMTPDSREAWHTFDQDLEEVIWATDWLHVNLARGPAK
jgi:hypothetical protein